MIIGACIRGLLTFVPLPVIVGNLAVEKCLISWGIKNVMTVTVDNASSNNLAIQYLQRRINHWNGSVLGGDYLHMRCAAHILNLIVKDGLKDVDVSIVKICGVVKYVRSSPSWLQKFKEYVEEEMIQSKSIVHCRGS